MTLRSFHHPNNTHQYFQHLTMDSSLSLQFPSSQDTNQLKPPHPQSNSSLHGVRKQPAKPWRRPELPAPPKVYRVDPHGFRRLVQQLTGMQRSAAPRMREKAGAPAPIKVEQRLAVPLMEQTSLQGGGDPEMMSQGPNGGMMGLLSPSFYSNWCSFPLLSPASMAALDS